MSRPQSARTPPMVDPRTNIEDCTCGDPPSDHRRLFDAEFGQVLYDTSCRECRCLRYQPVPIPDNAVRVMREGKWVWEEKPTHWDDMSVEEWALFLKTTGEMVAHAAERIIRGLEAMKEERGKERD